MFCKDMRSGDHLFKRHHDFNMSLFLNQFHNFLLYLFNMFAWAPERDMIGQFRSRGNINAYLFIIVREFFNVFATSPDNKLMETVINLHFDNSHISHFFD
eukprot:Lithocolla_globosa_v1_NODE_536_length_3800_cov_6.335381.p3 type:complete len:100 gc:universal NODE_536_length_3800_cov_6.335381:1925-2224(+)